MEKEECLNSIFVLKQTQKALANKDTIVLKDLSNRTIHSSCSFQDEGSLITAVLIYALSKLIERRDYQKIPEWNFFVKKFNSLLEKAILALQKNNLELYGSSMKKARSALETLSPNMKYYIKEVLRKAAINKGSKLYEHGLSLEQTAKLLGITLWELSDYTGQRNIHDIPENESIPVEQRAKIAMEFFS